MKSREIAGYSLMCVGGALLLYDAYDKYRTRLRVIEENKQEAIKREEKDKKDLETLQRNKTRFAHFNPNGKVYEIINLLNQEFDKGGVDLQFELHNFVYNLRENVCRLFAKTKKETNPNSGDTPFIDILLWEPDECLNIFTYESNLDRKDGDYTQLFWATLIIAKACGVDCLEICDPRIRDLHKELLKRYEHDIDTSKYRKTKILLENITEEFLMDSFRESLQVV